MRVFLLLAWSMNATREEAQASLDNIMHLRSLIPEPTFGVNYHIVPYEK
jgi:hypothetical protein